MPEWFKVRPPSGAEYTRIKGLREDLQLATVCEEARCPNIGECWGGGTATFMVMGDTCTRGCRFCAVSTMKAPPALDPEEPRKLSHAIGTMGLEYVVITTVDRDDLPDQGSSHLARCILQLRMDHPDLLVETLMGDLQGRRDLIDNVIEAGSHVLAHNVETVERLTPQVRDPRASYQQSLDVLAYIKQRSPATFTKSSIMVGLGETEDEVLATMDDLRAVGVEFLTIGQYLRPSARHLEVMDFIHPDVFRRYEEAGLAKGFRYVASGPLVRSSYRAGEYYIKAAIDERRQQRAEKVTG